jgi:hypothetical protein
MFDKHIKIVTVDKEKVEGLISLFRMKLFQYIIIGLLSICIALYFILNSYVMIPKQNLLQMDIEQLNEYINEDKAELVYNYIKENGLIKYNELEDINGVGLKTIQKLEKFTYIKGVD